ncbi:Thiamine pyrophosphate enzyme, N-terminal TPP binding domain [Rhizobiales bacterium GAS191]|nr:Thiamine pyrophosphate enzyme, N-terminal TPP binding domain [Rhizobiales bacterium GAS113]SED78907.1 Thiamine pyrophosphate enzyme, N-terminal TPP binding domain [Rhizobiales bacterium GAS191]
MSKRVADMLAETLQAAGVKTCYGIAGDTLNRIAHAIDRSEIDWVHMRHEEAGAFAAAAPWRRRIAWSPEFGPRLQAASLLPFLPIPLRRATRSLIRGIARLSGLHHVDVHDRRAGQPSALELKEQLS